MNIIGLIMTYLVMSPVGGPCKSVKTEVFSWHPNGAPVTLYDDVMLTDKRMDIYPDAEEDMAGCILAIDLQVGEGIRVTIEPSGSFYAAKGTLAVNTRNYDNDYFFLYDRPNLESEIVMQSKKQETVTIYGICDGWLYVNAISDDGQNVKGWLPPNMQCGNPYTTCN